MLLASETSLASCTTCNHLSSNGKLESAQECLSVLRWYIVIEIPNSILWQWLCDLLDRSEGISDIQPSERHRLLRYFARLVLCSANTDLSTPHSCQRPTSSDVSVGGCMGHQRERRWFGPCI